MPYSTLLTTLTLLTGIAAAQAGTCTHTVPFNGLAKIGENGECTFQASTVTATETVDCGPCTTAVMQNIGGIGPACRGVTTAPGTTTMRTAVCSSGAPAPTATNSALSFNPGGPITPAPSPTASKSCTRFFTSTPGCNPAADNINECMTTICSSDTRTVETSTKPSGTCVPQFEVFGASVRTIKACPTGA